MRVNSRNTTIPILTPNRKSLPVVNNNKKALLKPIPSKPNDSYEMDDENQPISDFPTPPYQIASYKHGQPGEMVTLPQILSAPIGEIPQLVLQKLKQCCRICDFSDKLADATSKVSKKATLNELIDCYSNPKLVARLSRECHQQLIEMFAANVFRPPPSIPRAVMISDDVIIEDTAWPHLQLVYILFLKFLECDIDPRIFQYKLDPKFISNLFAILDFPDERERIQAKTAIATIHNKVPPQRKILHNLTLNLLMSVPEGLEMNAATHLLDLFYLFTESQLPPLQPALIQAFERVLLPLHLHARCQRYFPSLVNCVKMLVQKDCRLGNSLLQFLIAHWPLTLDHKSQLFIEEITQILDDSMPKCIDQNIEGILRCICISAKSSCTTVADKSLKFLLHNRIQNLIVEDPDHLLGVIFPTLYQIAREHWHRNLQLEALNVMNALVCLVPQEFTQAAAKFKQDVLSEGKRKDKKKRLWDSIAQIAIENDQTIDAESVNSEFTAFYGANKHIPAYLAHARQKAQESKDVKAQKSQIVIEFNGVEEVEDYDSSDSAINSSRVPSMSNFNQMPVENQYRAFKRRSSNNDILRGFGHHHKNRNLYRIKSKDCLDFDDSSLSDGERVSNFYEREAKISYDYDYAPPSILHEEAFNNTLENTEESLKNIADYLPLLTSNQNAFGLQHNQHDNHQNGTASNNAGKYLPFLNSPKKNVALEHNQSIELDNVPNPLLTPPKAESDWLMNSNRNPRRHSFAGVPQNQLYNYPNPFDTPKNMNEYNPMMNSNPNVFGLQQNQLETPKTMNDFTPMMNSNQENNQNAFGLPDENFQLETITED